MILELDLGNLQRLRRILNVRGMGTGDNIEASAATDAAGNLVVAWRSAIDSGGGVYAEGDIFSVTCLYKANQEAPDAFDKRCGQFPVMLVTAASPEMLNHVPGNDAKSPFVYAGPVSSAVIGWQEKTAAGEYTGTCCVTSSWGFSNNNSDRRSV